VPAVPFGGPDRYYATGVQHTVPNVAGLTVSIAETELEQAGFNPQLSGTPVQSSVRAGLVARTSPGGGAQAAVGATVVIYVSGGSHAPPGPQPTTTVKPTKKPGKPTPPPTASSTPTQSASNEPTPTASPSDGGGVLAQQGPHRRR
jgi:beta-lactam-binding protein with PASTA domain